MPITVRCGPGWPERAGHPVHGRAFSGQLEAEAVPKGVGPIRSSSPGPRWAHPLVSRRVWSANQAQDRGGGLAAG
jgi:hypothetical protein